jgi:hypothetical protein
MGCLVARTACSHERVFAMVDGVTQRRSTRRRQVACWEAAKRMRSEVRHREDTTRWVECRRDWPDFFEAVDEIVGLLDEDDPPIPIFDAR